LPEAAHATLRDVDHTLEEGRLMRTRTAITRGRPAASGAQQVKAYIDAAPKPARAMLRQLRALVRATVPAAEEKLSYGMPYYGLNARLVYFAAFQSHVGVYLMGRSKEQFSSETARWRSTANTMRFDFDERLPTALLRRILRARVKETLAGALPKAKASTKREATRGRPATKARASAKRQRR